MSKLGIKNIEEDINDVKKRAETIGNDAADLQRRFNELDEEWAEVKQSIEETLRKINELAG